MSHSNTLQPSERAAVGTGAPQPAGGGGFQFGVGTPPADGGFTFGDSVAQAPADGSFVFGDAASPAPAGIAVGVSVAIFGLTGAPECNGLEGTVLERVAGQADRWSIRLRHGASQGGKKILGVREKNLRILPDAAESLASGLADVQLGDVVFEVEGTRFTTTEKSLNNHPNSFFIMMLRQRENFATSEDGAFVINRPAALFRPIFQFITEWPLGTLIEPNLSPEALDDLAAEADYFQLTALAWLASAHSINRHILVPTDLLIRQQEDALRWLFAQERDSALLQDDLHLGLKRIHRLDAPLTETKSEYTVVFDHISPKKVKTSKLNNIFLK